MNNEESDIQTNREHKNSVFKMLFSKPQILRELYSAIEGVELPPDIPIDINTISGALVKGIRNDISFIIDNRLVVLTEHQSTLNPNMPLRIFRYFEKVLNKIVDYRKIFNKQLIKIPRPKFIVLYNGKAPFPEHETLKLSDAFMDTDELAAEDSQVSLELTVQVYNVNHGQNPEIQQKCDTLNEYGLFIDKIREYEKTGLTLDESVVCAVKYCIDKNVLKDFLREHGSEVISMMVEEYTTEDFLEAMMEEAVEEGFEKGFGKGHEEGIEKGIEKGIEEGFEKGIERGRDEGREEGREKGREEILQFLEQGLSVEEIKLRLEQRTVNR